MRDHKQRADKAVDNDKQIKAIGKTVSKIANKKYKKKNTKRPKVIKKYEA